MEDRRKYPRYDFQFPVTFSGPGASGEGVALNLSREGCLVESDVTAPEGEYLELTLHLPDAASPMVIESAAVRWVRERIFGVEFLYMSLSEYDRLDHVIEALRTPRLADPSEHLGFPGQM